MAAMNINVQAPAAQAAGGAAPGGRPERGVRERGQRYAVSHGLGAGRERSAGKRTEICGESWVEGREREECGKEGRDMR